MLPRLRFVVAAAIAIALAPMLFLGTGFITTAHEGYVQDVPGVTSPRLFLGPEANRELLEMLAYARRSNELSRLQELSNEPVSTWVKSPVGPIAPELKAPSTAQTPAVPSEQAILQDPPVTAVTPEAKPDEPVASAPGPIAPLPESTTAAPIVTPIVPDPPVTVTLDFPWALNPSGEAAPSAEAPVADDITAAITPALELPQIAPAQPRMKPAEESHRARPKHSARRRVSARHALSSPEAQNSAFFRNSQDGRR